MSRTRIPAPAANGKPPRRCRAASKRDELTPSPCALLKPRIASYNIIEKACCASQHLARCRGRGARCPRRARAVVPISLPCAIIHWERCFWALPPILQKSRHRWLGNKLGRQLAATVRVTGPALRRIIRCKKETSGPNENTALVEKPDHRHGRLLRPRRERPRDRCAAEQRDELAAFHSITSSASASNLSGTSRPSAFAVLRFMISSNLVGACTGRSAGFSPLRMRSMYPATWRYASVRTEL